MLRYYTIATSQCMFIFRMCLEFDVFFDHLNLADIEKENVLAIDKFTCVHEYFVKGSWSR